MLAHLKDRLCFAHKTNSTCYLLNRSGLTWLAPEKLHHGSLDFDDAARCLFPRFHSGLMIRVDVHQRRVKANTSFKQGNQNANAKWRDLIDRECQGLAPALEKRLPSTQ